MKFGAGIRNKLAITTAVAAVFVGYGRRAYAQCTPGPNTYTCAGGTTTATGYSFTGTNTNVSTTAPFNPTATAASAIAITGTGDLNFTDANGSVITSTFPLLPGSGIFASANTGGVGSITINQSNGGSITGAVNGIYAVNAGSTTITVTGDITATSTVYGQASGIFARNGVIGSPNVGTTLTITTGQNSTVTGSWGIQAQNFGTGQATAHIYGTVRGTRYDGVVVDNGDAASVPTGSGIQVITGTNEIYGHRNGVVAQNFGYGNTLVITNGPITANTAQGISTNSTGKSGSMTVRTFGYVHAYGGGTTAVQVQNGGTGPTTVDTYAKVTGGYNGINVYNKPGSAGSLTLTTHTGSVATGGYSGIRVSNYGTGTTSVTTNAAVVGGTANGITAYDRASAGSSTVVTNAAVTGGKNGISAQHYGTGALTITANAITTGTANYGIKTNSTSATASSITVGGTGVAQGGTAGIYSKSTAGASATSITNAGTVRNLSGASDALAIKSNGTATTIVNTGLVLGTVNLGDVGDNSFDNKSGGVWNTAGGTNEFDPGPNSVTNETGGVIIAASNPAAAQITTFNGLATFINAGIITMQDGFAGDRTVVTGTFIGQGGTIRLDTFLGTDGSASDQLVLNGGTANGTTLLAIRNTTGPGAATTADGIKVVDSVNGATTTPTAFRLASAVEAGLYEYSLFYGGVGGDANDQDWYLRNVGLGTSAQTALPYVDILGNYAEATLGTLQQRTGNRIWPNGTPPETIWCKDPAQNYRCTVTASQNGVYANGGPVIYGAGAWGRIAGQYSSYDPNRGSSYTQGLGFLQAGYEGVARESAGGDVTVGAYATIGSSRADIDLTPDPATGAARRGHIDTTGYGLGVNATWLGSDGLYVDGIGQFSFYDSDLSNKTGGNNQGWSTALSVEAGKRFDLGSGWAIVPQAQLAWTHVDFNSFTDSFGTRISLGDGDSLRGRAGLRVEKTDSWQGADNQARRLQLYGIANLSYEFLNGTSVVLDNTSIEQRDKRLWGEIGLGGTYAWNDKWSVYGEADYSTALASHFGDNNYTLKGTAGLRYKW